MNILLATAKAPEENPFFTHEKRPPAGGVFSLISVLKQEGHKVIFVDNYTIPTRFIEEGVIQKHQIDVVGIYCCTPCWRDCLDMVHKLHFMRLKKEWKGKIILGGPHLSVLPHTIPVNFIDHAVIGEGEEVLPKILKGEITEKLVYAPRIMNLDKLPFPAYEIVANNKAYTWDSPFLPAPVYPMNTSRGCPHKCSFCGVGKIWGKEYTAMSAPVIVSWIKKLKAMGAKSIYFREDNFVQDKKRLDAFCKLMVKEKVGMAWMCEARLDNFIKSGLKNYYGSLYQKLKKLRDAGCAALYMGIESGSYRIQEKMNKILPCKEGMEAFFDTCHKLKIKIAASIISGFPGEETSDVRATSDLLRFVRPAVTWNNVFVAIPGSPIYDELKKNNEYALIDDKFYLYGKNHNDLVNAHYSTHPKKVAAYVPYPNNKKPVISVLMSAYNVEKYVGKAIESILRQTYQNFEIYIVDDKSEDKTLEIVEEYAKADKRIKVYRNPYPCGLTKNLNNLAKTCTGHYLARMDADDISLELRFEKQMEFLQQNANVAAVGTTYYHMDVNDKVTQWINLLCKPETIKAGLRNQNWFAHGSLMFRRAPFIGVGGYNEQFTYAQDYELFVRLSRNFGLANLEIPYYCYRIRPENISIKHKAEQAKFAEQARRLAQ